MDRILIRIISVLKAEIHLNDNVKVVTRPPLDFKGKDQADVKDALGILNNAGFQVIYKSNIHQKFAIIDDHIVWYGSINLLSFGSAEESLMRLKSAHIAHELVRSLGVLDPPKKVLQ